MVQSSSYTIGEALLWSSLVRDENKYAADLYLRAYSERNAAIPAFMEYELKYIGLKVEFAKIIAQYDAEFARIAIVAYKEQTDKQLEIDEKDARWDLGVYQYGGNFMAAIAGAASTVQTTPGWQSQLGGVFSGIGAASSIIGGMGTALAGGTATAAGSGSMALGGIMSMVSLLGAL
jgi:hypothetical protein